MCDLFPMKTKLAIGFLVVPLILGTVQAAPPDGKTVFETTRRKALDLHASLIAQAAPPVRAKIAASAAATRKYLTTCGLNCNLYRFLSQDLGGRFKRPAEREIHLLMALVFAETVGDDSQLSNLDLQDKLQKQQQFIQTISNIIKSDHDTLKAIIDNLRD